MRSIERWAQRCAALALWGLLILVVAAVLDGTATSGQELNHATLVIEFGDGRTEQICVSFAEDEISGAELLRRSGLPVVVAGFGGLGAGVCQIDSLGCDNPGDCFCQCRGAECEYWSYWTVDEGAWRYEVRGASGRMVGDGDVDVWVWGPGRSLPPEASPDASACPDEAPTARPPAAAPPDSGPGPAAVQPTTASSADPGGGTPGDPPPAARGTAVATPRATELVRRPAATPAVEVDALQDDDAGSAAPVGLIAFGAVAGAIVLAGGGVALRRRLRG